MTEGIRTAERTTVGGWDDFDASALEDEKTQLSEEAHRKLLKLAGRQLDDGWAYAIGGAALRVRTGRGYVVEVRGQSSAAGHGKQGLHPARAAALRELEEPVLVVFVDHGCRKMQWLWLDAAPPAENMDNDPAHRRQGWWVRDLNRCSVDAFEFPDAAPNFDPTDLGRLI